jgi:uncharacterized phage protein gp47/JayE
VPFARPTLTQLRNTAIQDITTSGVPGLTGLLRNSVLRVLAWTIAGLCYSVYGYADWIARMGVPFTAEDEFLYAWAALIGIYPKPAASASGHAAFTGNPGVAILAKTALMRIDGVPYETTADGVTDGAGNVTVPIAATVTGAITNAEPDTPINIAHPITGINSGGLTVGPLVGGADIESNDELRTRMLEKYRAPPQGGAASDYVQWASEVPGVTRAWCLPMGMGPGTVTVYTMWDHAGHGGFPQGADGVAAEEQRKAPKASGDQQIVADHIFPVQPVTALVYSCGPIPYPVDVILSQLVPNSIEIQAEITASLNDMFLIEGDPGGVIYPSDIYEAILATPGVDHCVVSQPVDLVQAPSGHLPVMGTLIVPAIPAVPEQSDAAD